jgi:maltooligosyltrehalose trehalohydrolase
LFQGQEYAASGPFLYFGDLEPEVADTMLEGRRKFLRQFPSLATPEMQARVPRPNGPAGFARSKLDPAEREKSPHKEALALHRDLLRLRRTDATLRAGQRPGVIDGAVLGPEALVLRWFDPRGEGDDRILLVNLGVELRLEVTPEPLLASPEGTRWRLSWSSGDPRYGGTGTPEPETEEHNWILCGHSAVLMAPSVAGKDEYRNPPGSV